MYGLGDTSTCGVNPCGLLDYIYASDACLNYKLCATPNDPTTILESQGLIAGSGTVLGTTVGQTISNIFQDPLTGATNWTMLGLGALALYFLTKR